jgi:hypothetical protein
MHLYKIFASGKMETTMCLPGIFLALTKGKKTSCILIKVFALHLLALLKGKNLHAS